MTTTPARVTAWPETSTERTCAACGGTMPVGSTVYGVSNKHYHGKCLSESAKRALAMLATGAGVEQDAPAPEGDIAPNEDGLLKALRDAIGNPEATVDAAQVEALVDEKLAGIAKPLPVQIMRGDVKGPKINQAHSEFAEVLDIVSTIVNGTRLNARLVGPAGSGKTYLARQIAKALGLGFGFKSLSGGTTETHLFGRKLPQFDGSWGYERTPFVKCYEEGGVFLLDEMDRSDPNVLTSLNAALANGHMEVAARVDNPWAHRHDDFVCIGAGNTWGHGSDRLYVGAMAQDFSTMDRFHDVHMGYDEGLEAELAGCPAVVARFQTIRAKAADAGLRRAVSMRKTIELSARHKSMGGKLTTNQCAAALTMSWSDEDRKAVGVNAPKE